MRKFARCAAAALALVGGVFASPALGWGARGHRMVTLLALDGLPEGMPAYLREDSVRARIAEQSNEADRYRGTKAVPLNHEVAPEHYIDLEQLEPYGLTIGTLPEHRYEYVKALAVYRAQNESKFAPIEKDSDKTKEWPGFLPYAINEHTAKLRSSFNTLRILDAVNDPAFADLHEQARQNVVYEMGMLAHFVGDAAQPLHTTVHHHGWIGDNPKGYTTRGGFHSYIDSGIVEHHGLEYDVLKGTVEYGPPSKDFWKEGVAEIERSFALMETLYVMQKDGSLEQQAGKDVIAGRLADAARTLNALYAGAWEASAPTPGEISAFLRYSERRAREGAGAAGDGPK